MTKRGLNKEEDLEIILEYYNRPQKKCKPAITLAQPSFKGIKLQEHLKWICTIPINERISQVEFYALQKEISRLKAIKTLNKECRKVAKLPIGITSRPCPCCKKWERKLHYCSHQFCDKPCRKKTEFLIKLKQRAEKRLQALSISDKIFLTEELVYRQLKIIMEEINSVFSNSMSGQTKYPTSIYADLEKAQEFQSARLNEYNAKKKGIEVISITNQVLSNLQNNDVKVDKNEVVSMTEALSMELEKFM